ncbi:MAG: hypothetical protein HN961_00970, partial [Planctomycetes bacterium]|nr:hypothetical protein [Planctomycetota bacterium]
MSFLRNQKRPTASAQSSRESGSALIAVLLALALLFSLGVPFLMTSRLRSESSRQSFDRVQAQIAVSSASDYAILIQGASHPAADATPLYDSSTEWDATHDDPLPQSLGDAWADTPESWGLEVESLQSRVSLASASPLLLQNLLHPCFLTSDATHDSDSLRVNSTAGFPESGLLFVNGEWVQYGSISAQAFLELVPAENAPDDTSSKRFRSGTALLDPRVWYLALSRFQEGHFETPEFFDDAFAFDFDDEAIELFPEQDRQLLADRTWLSTGSFGSPLWMPPEWLTREVSADNPDILFVSDANAFAPGTVIRIQPEVGDPFDTIVLAVESNMGVLRIANPAPLDLLSWRTRVYPMRREPVDLNAAHPDILAALVTGVRFRNAPSMVIDIPPTGSPTSDWVSPSQAQQFAQRVIDSRPLTGPEDLWLRVLRPMAVANELTDYEAWAVWLNGMDSSHGLLSQSTTGFAYRSGERYLTRVEAAVRSRLGNTLSRYRRILQTFAAPAGLLLQMWQSQETFEDLARWSRGMHRVVSFPSNVGHLQTSDNSDSPTALTLQLGTFSEIGRMSPEGDLELSSIRPETVRDQPIEGSGVIGEVEHFDFETHPFGRDLASRGPIRTTAADWSIDDSNGFSSTQPIHLQGWFEMPPGLGDATLFDLSGLEIDRQRVSMGIQQGMLKLRVFDNAGDDPGDEDNIVQAVEWSLDPAEYALSDRWVHLAVLLRTAHPRGAQLAVDGIPRGTSNCLTWLTQQSASWAPGDPDGILAVESTNGFPSRGVLKVGEELMEYSSKTETSFDLARSLAPNAHIGGRAARESSDTAMGIVDSTHPSGAGVELYGYSALLESDIPPGLGQLDGTMGPWSVATAVEGEDTIDVMLLSGDTLTLGDGIEGGYIGPIELAVMEVGDPHYLEAFQSKGGYALIFQSWFRDGSGEVWRDKDGFMIGGFEIVRYSERTDTGIVLSERAVQSPGTAAADVPDYAFDDEGSSFITDWEPGFGEALGQAFEDDPLYRVFIMPISVKGTGVFDVSYLNPTVEFSEFVQVAPFGDAGKTEWVRYDSIFNGNFMRDHWGALSSAVFHLLREVGANIPQDPSAIPISGLSADASTPQVTIRTPAASQSAAWDVFTHTLGEREPTRDLVIEEIRRQFDFRGVLGTFDHYQEQESDLIPVFRTTRAAMDSSSGYVG